jgi:hypothetical protein
VADKASARTRKRLVELGDDLRRLRQALGVSRASLAETLGKEA